MTDFNSIREDLEREIYLAEEVRAQYAEKVPVDLLKDTLNLLKNQDEALKHLRILFNIYNGSQEPHMMTLEEYQLIAYRPKNDLEPVWEEWRDNESKNRWTMPDPLCAGYGLLWRCWTSRPSLEQMRDTKWEVEDDG